MDGGLMNVYMASDLHIGYEDSNYEKIKQFFNIVRGNANELYLCGDVFDLWRYPYDKMIGEQKSDFEDIMSDLKRTAAKVPTTIIPGNHDYNLLNLWKNYQEYHVSIADSFEKEKIYFCHGWNFDIMQRSASFAYQWIVLAFPGIYQAFFKKPSQILLRNDVESPEIAAIHKEAEQYALKNKLKYVVMGHTHFPIIRDHIIDCGDFVDSASYVILNKGEPELKFI